MQDKKTSQISLIRKSCDDPLSNKTRASQGRQINDLLCINDLKHMDDSEDGYIVMDVEECALGAILKTLANYVRIAGREKDFVKGFLAWVRLEPRPEEVQYSLRPKLGAKYITAAWF